MIKEIAATYFPYAVLLFDHPNATTTRAFREAAHEHNVGVDRIGRPTPSKPLVPEPRPGRISSIGGAQ